VTASIAKTKVNLSTSSTLEQHLGLLMKNMAKIQSRWFPQEVKNKRGE
jgi:hypothetical protein